MIVLVPVNVIWAYRDAKQRNGSGILAALLVFVGPFPVGVFLWLIFRPKLSDDYIESENVAESTNENKLDADAALKERANAGHL